MILVGVLDSPFVRRTAISFATMGVAFEHKPLSVFSTFGQFQAINPVVKAPSLVLESGDVLMDSSLIIEYAESMISPAASLMPNELQQKAKALRIIGLALAACEKAAQIIYEQNLRPREKQHQPWLDRVSGQLLAACYEIEQEISRFPEFMRSDRLSQAGITTAVTWQFIQSMVPEVVRGDDYPFMRDYSAAMELRTEFLKYPPIGPGVVANT